MGQQSAGIMLYRERAGKLEVLIGHPGGPFWAGRDAGAWSIPKGLIEPGEEPLRAARREFEEETGFILPDDDPIELGMVTLASGKQVLAWAIEGDADPARLTSNPVEITWPRGSERRLTFPEIDRVIWADVSEALVRLNPAQTDLVRRLAAHLGVEITT